MLSLPVSFYQALTQQLFRKRNDTFTAEFLFITLSKKRTKFFTIYLDVMVTLDFCSLYY